MKVPRVTNIATEDACFQCGREIKDNLWFARFMVAGQRVVFCRPSCVEQFFTDRDQAEAREAAAFHPLEP